MEARKPDLNATEKKCQVRRNNRARVTYIVSTKSAQLPDEETRATTQHVEDATIEHALLGAQNIAPDILDELDALEKPETGKAKRSSVVRREKNVLHLKSFLNSLEILAHHWALIEKSKYTYRQVPRSGLETLARELPLEAEDGHFFHIKTFVLSCKRVFVTTLDARRLFIDKEFYQSAGKLHLAFATVRDLFERLAERVKNYREGGGFFNSLFRTFIASNPLHD